MTERLANLGYMAVGKETTPGVAVIPTFFVPLYEESMETMANFQKLNPIVGNKFATQATIPGIRSHGGKVTVQGEANTAAHLFNMLLTRGSITGSGPYSMPYTGALSGAATYTVDIYTGNMVKRFVGVQAAEIAPNFNNNELQLDAVLAALGSFQGREIASVSTNTIVLKTDYDPSPSTGLVATDLVRITNAAGSNTLDTTVTSITNGTTLVLGASAAAFAAGDMITIRNQTPAYNNLPVFRWDSTVVGFGATAAAALTNATRALQTRVEEGSNWKIIHNFEKSDGSKRSGSRDPAVLIRTTVDGELKIKKVFDTPEELRRFNSLEKQACVVRHFAGPNDMYELRAVFNNLTIDKPTTGIKSDTINYVELEYVVNNDATDGQATSALVASALTTV